MIEMSRWKDRCTSSKNACILELDRCIGTLIYIGQYNKLSMYHIGKIPPIYISNICSWKCYAVVLHEVFGNPSCYFFSDPEWIMQMLSCF